MDENKSDTMNDGLIGRHARELLAPKVKVSLGEMATLCFVAMGSPSNWTSDGVRAVLSALFDRGAIEVIP